MKALGRHVLLELRTCNPELLDDLEFLKKVLLEAAVKTGATVIGEIFHQFSPQGVTGVVAIAESHLCIHTWPEFGYAGVDIFTCGENFSCFLDNGPAGVAFGGMARKIIQPWLIEADKKQVSLKEWPEGLEKALEEARELVSPWLSRQPIKSI